MNHKENRRKRISQKKTDEITSDPNKNDKFENLAFLEQKVKLVQNNKRILRRQILELEKNVSELKSEAIKLKKPPLLTGFIEEIFDTEDLVIVKSTTGTSYAISTKSILEKDKIKIGTKVSLNQRHFSIIDVLPPTYDNFIANLEVIGKTEVSFRDVGGLDSQIQDIVDAVQLPFEKPKLFSHIGIEPPRGILLYGPPGSGKTLLAKAIANETKCVFINVVGSSLVQTFLGEGIRLVKELFEFAQKRAPTIIFIDELDAIGSKREVTTAGDLEVQRTLMQLLSQLDGFKRDERVKIIGSTNRIEVLDPALIRPGRFDRIIFFPLPDKDARKSIFSIYFKKINNNIDLKNLNKIITLTEGYSGADIKTICTEAGLQAIRIDKDQVTSKELMLAYNMVSLTKRKNSQNQDEFFN
jgi:proteasome regulatory subunit